MFLRLMPVFLGLDCGGTSTRALAVDEEGNIVHRGKSGPGNVASTPFDCLLGNLLEALEGCPKADYAVGCFAGLLTKKDRDLAISLLESTSGAIYSAVYADYEAALKAASQSADGLVIAGTGSLVCSRKDGVTVKTGGGGPLIGDEGSVFSICRRAIWLTMVTANRLEASTEFWDDVELQFGTRDPNSVVSSIYRLPSPARDICRLSQVVMDDYLKGLNYAVQSVHEPMRNLANETAHHFHRFHPEKKHYTVSLAGGLWKVSPAMEKVFEGFLNETQLGQFTTEILSREPVEGAVLLAKKLEK